jgi:hypothetical protein
MRVTSAHFIRLGSGVKRGVAWLVPRDRRNDNGPLVGVSLGHAWSPSTRGFGVALALSGSLAFFGDYETSHIARYGTLGFITLSLRLSYGLPL